MVLTSKFTKMKSLHSSAPLGLGMQVMGYDPDITVDAAWGLPSQVKKANSIEDLLKHSDFVTLHIPLLDTTRGLINSKRVQAMKQGSVLLNFARDAIVDEDAILAGIAAKHAVERRIREEKLSAPEIIQLRNEQSRPI